MQSQLEIEASALLDRLNAEVNTLIATYARIPLSERSFWGDPRVCRLDHALYKATQRYVRRFHLRFDPVWEATKKAPRL